MIKKIQVQESLITSIAEYLKHHNLGNRGVEDGNRRKQEVGLIGELVIHHFLFGKYPDLTKRPDGYDGGYDILYNGKRIDVKTMERKSYVRPDYVNNFYILQENHHADIIVFCSYHNIDGVIEICGWLPKNELAIRGIYYPAGTQRIRTDGSTFIFRQSNYEVKNKDLNDMDTLKFQDFK
jgi:hypothetical protein